MSKVNYNDIDLEEMDDEVFDDLYEDDKKIIPKFKDDGSFKKKTKTTRKKDTKK